TQRQLGGRVGYWVLWLVGNCWGDMDPALEAMEDTFNTVFVTIAQDRILQRQSRVSRIGDKGFPAKTLAARRDGPFLPRDVGNVIAGCLDHALCAVHSASPPAHVLGGLLNLLFPDDAEQPIHPMCCEHTGNGL